AFSESIPIRLKFRPAEPRCSRSEEVSDACDHAAQRFPRPHSDGTAKLSCPCAAASGHWGLPCQFSLAPSFHCPPPACTLTCVCCTAVPVTFWVLLAPVPPTGLPLSST